MVHSLLSVLLPLSCFAVLGDAFQSPSSTTARRRHHSHDDTSASQSHRRTPSLLQQSSSDSDDDNAAMAFLRKKGRIGGAANMDFADAMGLDESPSGGTKSSYHEDGFLNVRKSKASYVPCTASGIVDDASEPFPFTSSGNQWEGITDRNMGGTSNGSLSREEDVGGRTANVLRGTVKPVLASNPSRGQQEAYGGGFIQIATLLALDQSVDKGFVDASEFDGVELEVYCEGEQEEESYNMHLRTPACERKYSSYRAAFAIPTGKWETVRLPWDAFEGHGSGPDATPFVPSLRRLGVVSIGEAKDVVLAVGKVGFYNVI